MTAAGLGVVEGGHGAAVVLDQLGHLHRCDALDIIRARKRIYAPVVPRPPSSPQSL